MAEKIISRYKAIWFCACLWGLSAHGMAMFNKYSFHDDASLFLVGGTYSSGRWMLGILDEGVRMLTGSAHYSVPLFNGVLVVVFIALSSMLISNLFEIESGLLQAALTGVMITFPVVTGLFGYIFTAPYYFFGTLMGIGGVWLCGRFRKWHAYLAGIILMACSIGIYQANLPVCVSLILIHMIKTVAERQNFNGKNLLMYYFVCATACIGSLVVYLGLNKIFLWIKDIRLTDYQEIGAYGQTSFGGYLARIRFAYKEFFMPQDGIRNMYPFSLGKIHDVIVAVYMLLTSYLIFKKMKKNLALGIQVFVLAILIPLAVNFIYFMCSVSTIHSLMMYGQVFIYVYIIWILSDMMKEKNIRMCGCIVNATVIMLFVLCLGYCRFDNICYLKAEYLQEQTKGYYSTLITQIKGVEGYTDEAKVVFINEFEKEDKTLSDIPQFDEIQILPYDTRNWINDYAWRTTMKMWCGFDPETVDSSIYGQLPEVVEMPSYPDAGSIKMVDGVVVVKF